jgi:hypothetical protein
LDYLTTHTSLSPIRRGFAPSFVNYNEGCTRLAAASYKVYQLLAHGRWFSPASSTTKTGRHDIAEILLKMALKHQKSKSNQIQQLSVRHLDKIKLLFTREILVGLFDMVTAQSLFKYPNNLKNRLKSILFSTLNNSKINKPHCT